MSAFDDHHWATQATFLEGVWKIIPDEDSAWVHRVARGKSDNGPLGDYSAIEKEMLEADHGTCPLSVRFPGTSEEPLTIRDSFSYYVNGFNDPRQEIRQSVPIDKDCLFPDARSRC